MVASTPVPRDMRRLKLASRRSSRDAIRSLIPSRSSGLGESRSSVTAAARNLPISFFVLESRSSPFDSEAAPGRMVKAERTRRRARKISIVLASHTVQVTTEANTSPIRTPLTIGSALRNMPHGVRSRGSVAVPMTAASPGSCASADDEIPSRTHIAAGTEILRKKRPIRRAKASLHCISGLDRRTPGQVNVIV